MKKSLFILYISLFFTLQAQEEIVVTMKDKSFTVGEVPSFVTFIPEASYVDVTKTWEKYLGQGTKEKVTFENGEFVILSKEYEKISATPINIYSYIKEYDRELLLVCAIEKDGEFVSRDMDEEIYIPAKKYVRDFAVESYQEAVADQIKDEEKTLKKMEGEKNHLLNQKESTLFNINQYERNIVTKQDEITLNKMDQSNKVLQIQAQKELILKLANAGEEEQDEAEKVLKDLEKDFKKLQKANENLHQDIDNYESYIRQEEISLAEIESEMKFVQLDIDDQEYKVRKLQQKLEDIKWLPALLVLSIHADEELFVRLCSSHVFQNKVHRFIWRHIA